jgi:hypothetical protein
MMAEGGFEVVWTSEGPWGNGRDPTNIQRQAYTSDGLPSGPQLEVSTSGGGGLPEMSMNRDGDFVATWSSDCIRGRIFRSTIFSDGFESGDANAWSLWAR